ncbi:MAG TPA: hypothetical protein VM432_03225 [Bdellovibrionales bacterium]|jgi:hypothetical protein|nr:hypothetical protein [Bdellovibrionales bacterium]
MNILNWLKPKKPPETDRAPRVVLPFFPLHFITNDGRDLLIANISTSGVGFQKTSFATLPPEETVLHGKLRLQDKNYALRLRVVHVSASIVGCIIDPQSSEYSNDLNHYLDVELSAVVLRPIDTQILKQPPEGKPQWYVGRQNSCELYLVENNGELKDFHCTIWGHYFESKKSGHKRFGVVSQAGGGSSSNIYPQAALVEDIKDPSKETMAMALRFLSNVPKIDERIRAQLIDRLRK